MQRKELQALGAMFALHDTKIVKLGTEDSVNDLINSPNQLRLKIFAFAFFCLEKAKRNKKDAAEF